jgi:hypothetical protein
VEGNWRRRRGKGEEMMVISSSSSSSSSSYILYNIQEVKDVKDRHGMPTRSRKKMG